jgi:hypothetical protein
MIFLNNETLTVPVEISNFGAGELKDVIPQWNISDKAGKVLMSGNLPKGSIAIGNGIQLGTIKQSLTSVATPSHLVLNISVGKNSNSWDFFVYPSALPKESNNVLVTQQLDAKAMKELEKGGKVLLTLKQGTIKPEFGGEVQIGFSSIFWNTSWTRGQAPHTLGILCNPNHPAFAAFPTEYHSNWQWWDAMSHSNAIRIDSIAKNIKPIVRVIDDWFKARPLGLVFECKVGKGSLIVSGIDLITDQKNRPEARQLQVSLIRYMESKSFNPSQEVGLAQLKSILKQ